MPSKAFYPRKIEKLKARIQTLQHETHILVLRPDSEEAKGITVRIKFESDVEKAIWTGSVESMLVGFKGFVELA